MKLVNVMNYEELSQKGCQILVETIQAKKDAIICLATGSSPERLYELFVETVHKKQIDLSEVTFVKLDEWCNLTPDNPSTCTAFLKKHLFEPLHQPIKQFIEFKSDAPLMEGELKKVDDFLNAHPIDVMILGLGMNGHLGLNEPSDSLLAPSHIVTLDQKTKTHGMLLGQPVEHGITIGMKGIFEAKTVLMLVSGNQKEEAFQQFMSQQITTKVPASLLWLHTNCITLIDSSHFHH